MNTSRHAPNPFADAPEMALRLVGILLAVAALIAARFLKNPRLVMLISPLWRKLRRAATRLERGFWPKPGARKAQTGQRGGPRPAVQLPSGRGWLVRELGYEAVAFGLRLEHVLADPAMQAVLAGAPAVGKLLRPFARMLGVSVPVAVVVPTAEEAEATVVAYYAVEDVGKAGATGGIDPDCSKSR
ncbi:MAG: hypothetical protein H7251_04220 [Acetobacteraceae bacterium]|nr:hypothetical protein [Acetobacteraceae bacterium]